MLCQFELFVGVEDGLGEVDAQPVEGFGKGLGQNAFTVVSYAEDLGDPHQQGPSRNLLKDWEQGVVDLF